MASDNPKFGGMTLSAWRGQYTAGDDEERKIILSKLEGLGIRAKAGVPVLIDALKDKDAENRAMAAHALCRLGENAVPAVAALGEALADKSPNVRRSAASALGAIGPAAAETVPGLVKMLEDNDTWNRIIAAAALAKIGPPPNALPLVAAILMDAKEQNEAFSVGQSLAAFGAPAVPHFAEALAKGNPHVRAAAASGLCDIGPAAKDAVPALIKALEDSSETVQNFSEIALGKIHARAEIAVPALIQALDSTNSELQRGAISALGEFGPDAVAAVPGLIAALNTFFVWLAAESLGRIGPAAAPALEPLKQVAASKNKQNRAAAQEAIRLISAQPLSQTEAAERDRFKPAAPGATLFDFGLTREVVEKLMREGIAEFAREHPNEELGAVGLIGWGFGCSATLCFGTASEAPSNWRGGLRELKYAEYAEETFGFWPDLYKVAQSFSIKMPNGTMVRRSSDDDEPDGGNNAIDKPLFDLLVQVMEKAVPFKGLRLAKGYRVGVEMHDSEFVKFWKPKT